jgi:hypothetical protein
MDQIKTTIYPLRKGRYLISINDNINLYELSFFNGNYNKAYEHAVFLLKRCVSKYCKMSYKETEDYFNKNFKYNLKGGID